MAAELAHRFRVGPPDITTFLALATETHDGVRQATGRRVPAVEQGDGDQGDHPEFAEKKGGGAARPTPRMQLHAASACGTARLAGMAYINGSRADSMRCSWVALTRLASTAWKRGSITPETMYCQR